MISRFINIVGTLLVFSFVYLFFSIQAERKKEDLLGCALVNVVDGKDIPVFVSVPDGTLQIVPMKAKMYKVYECPTKK